ncbi:hypothetical protein PV11_09345 [Exophiala sideris]|uniref:Uncharacterized protein n=1 Tax=Exophiala sideris TaxID=1016849 RepID=A0A0D1VNK9_9EURO|nr:hypothetical protein PV11_09345 [Exophiala sideris]
MSTNKRIPSGMLEPYLHDTTTLAERAAKEPERNLRDTTRSNQAAGDTTDSRKREKEKRDAVLARQLDRDMNRRTNKVLLCNARKDQQGLKDGTRSYA